MAINQEDLLKIVLYKGWHPRAMQNTVSRYLKIKRNEVDSVFNEFYTKNKVKLNSRFIFNPRD